MCYSAQVHAEIKSMERELGVRIDEDWYVQAFWTGGGGKPAPDASASAPVRPRFPRAMALDAIACAPPAIAAAVRDADRDDLDALTREIFAQRRRVADARRRLETRSTKKAQEDVRIGTAKVDAALLRVEELRAPKAAGGLGRIYPGWYCPVVIREGDRHVARAMRYRCRLPGWTDAVERRYPGTYNARRDRLDGPWREVFGHGHGVIVARSFYEHVERDGRDVVLEFEPADARPMIVACLWTRTVEADGRELLSFAAVTDDPPPEIREAGHDRCIVPIRRANLDAWLTPDPHDLAAMDAILEDRERPLYRYREAA